MDQQPVLGIDIGSVSLSCALLAADGKLLGRDYRFHGGKVRDALAAAVASLGAGTVARLGVTGSGAGLLRAGRPLDWQVCLITAARRLQPGLGGLLWIGGERFGLIRFDETGSYIGTRSNSSCAAGTGSFLDQQARRLGLAGSRELAAAALEARGDPPRISTRCAVFARTDLVHAQQSGYSVGEICDGLCRGLAQIVADTLLAGEPIRPPVLFAGGVAANEAVRRHLERLLGAELRTHELAPALGAVGAGLRLLDGGGGGAVEPTDLSRGIDALLGRDGGRRQYFFEPLTSKPAARSPARRAFLHDTGRYTARHAVEVEVYREPGEAAADDRRLPVWLGIDVGSTSTKAMLMDATGSPVLGLYTRTLGRPVTAAQALLEVASGLAAEAEVELVFLGTATTGAGRRFVGKIVGADLVVDEISAHARAALALDPEVDTIIEIGGQDAKFTTLRDGRVTFAHMNTVCAAGTGSFLEEQALRLGCSLASYAERVAGVRAPLASDRCAVFMERDINDLLSRGFSVEEILAASLFSVRENYLQKVARGATIGRRVCFQGATARNRALVAAFEQGLGRPVSVSPFCHLTGAMGAALLLREGRASAAGAATAFRGLAAVLEREIPIRGETCELCANHCRLRIAEVAGETVAYGFLCGRDYDTHRFVNANRSGFDLLAERRRAFERGALSGRPATGREGPLVGLPAALSTFEELGIWERFFGEFGVRTVTSEGCPGAIAAGRNLEGAEFCAPLAALHGHVAWLAERADRLFLPVQLEERHEGIDAQRSYCYYTQYSSALVSAIEGARGRTLMPFASFTRHRGRTVRELREALASLGVPVPRARVAAALERSVQEHRRSLERLRQRFREEMASATEPRVVLLGRPYTVLSPEMNKNIPAIFGSLGVKAFFQDMVPYRRADVAEIQPLLEALPWHYAARILEVAAIAARTPQLYPVYITSFKCSPDSFAVECFKRILDHFGKPYLVLQLDDHDSSMGYESRIEAGVAAFRNHAAHAPRERSGDRRVAPIMPRLERAIAGRTLLFVDFDPVSAPLVVAALRREGVDARLLRGSDRSIRAGMRHNTGQCIPVNVIVQEAVDTIRAEGLDPSRTLLWIMRGGLSCNFPMFPSYMKSLLDELGMPEAGVYVGDISNTDISLRATLNTARAYLFGGYLRRICCRLRPYERVPGSTDRALARALDILVHALERPGSRGRALARALRCFDRVEVRPGRRPKVAIFGDLYSRDNDLFNQGLIRAIEEAGGEAVVTPALDYVRIVNRTNLRKSWLARDWHGMLMNLTVFRLVHPVGRWYHRYARRFLGPYRRIRMRGARAFVKRFGVRDEHTWESYDNLLKIYHLVREQPDLRLFVQASPAFCCPSLVTEAMARNIQRVTGVPVVSVTYDGTGQYRNDAIVPYLAYARPTADRPPPHRRGAGAATPGSAGSPP